MGYVETFKAGDWDHCDGCQKAIPKSEGTMERIDGQSILFFCYVCAK